MYPLLDIRIPLLKFLVKPLPPSLFLSFSLFFSFPLCFSLSLSLSLFDFVILAYLT